MKIFVQCFLPLNVFFLVILCYNYQAANSVTIHDLAVKITGGIAQLGECLTGSQEVTGSSPVISTRIMTGQEVVCFLPCFVCDHPRYVIRSLILAALRSFNGPAVKLSFHSKHDSQGSLRFFFGGTTGS